MTSPVARAAAVLAASILAASCRGGPAGPDAGGARVDRYPIRGEIVGLAAGAGGRAPSLTLRHEAVPGFRDAGGKVVGMAAMVMTFEVAGAAWPRDGAPGDAVEAVLAVDWSAPAFRLEEVRKLPNGTPLRFDAGTGAGPAAPR